MKLLVSPSSIEEAKFCLDADIIDVKRPAEGSLGANFPWVIREIKKMAGEKPVSAAIGDYGPTPGNAALAAYRQFALFEAEKWLCSKARLDLGTF